MKVSVYSLKKVLFEGDAESLNCKTENGEITILDHHRPLISILKTGDIQIVDASKKEHDIPVSSGFLEVGSGNRMNCIV